MKRDTFLAHAGSDPRRFEGLVNPPVSRGSTILHENMEAFRAALANKHEAPYYGRYGTSTSKVLAAACAQLDAADGAILYPSGLAAIVGVLNALLEPGAHLLMVDTVYGPVREFCDTVLRQQGIDTTWYRPDAGASIASLLLPHTRVVYCESPGSLTFEVQDLPAIAQAVAGSAATIVVDNTWATSYFFRPLEHGAHISIQAATKYLVGHSDAMLGVATARSAHLPVLKRSAALCGNSVSADDCYLALRGLRTLGVRLRQHQAGALQVARWLQSRPEISRVLYPPLSGGPDQELWQRDFSGASGLFGVEFRAGIDATQVDAFVDRLHLFGIGVSWGGYESLVLPSHPKRNFESSFEGLLVRLHVGLEDPDDLIADLAHSLDLLTRDATRSC